MVVGAYMLTDKAEEAAAARHRALTGKLTLVRTPSLRQTVT
jgi:hypothetical protein